MKNEISISTDDFANLALKHVDLAGRNDCGIYVDKNGDIDLRHSGEPMHGWCLVMPMCNSYDAEWLAIDDDDSDDDERIEWIKTVLPSLDGANKQADEKGLNVEFCFD